MLLSVLLIILNFVQSIEDQRVMKIQYVTKIPRGRDMLTEMFDLPRGTVTGLMEFA